MFAQMIREGAQNLTRNVKQVDALNVFPVPDGDTGTNMNLSFTSGVNEMNKYESTDITEVTKALSKGLLMGARGNSGVILSQLFRGFSKSIEGTKEIDAKQFANALQQGVDTAYKAVMKPVEGTILTVSKDAAKMAQKMSQKVDDITYLMQEVLTEAKASLKRTPDLLPILKQVGVVDSGGQGLVYVYEGMLRALKGETFIENTVHEEVYELKENKEEHVRDEVSSMMASGVLSVEDIEYGYCTEFMIRLDKQKAPQFNEFQFRERINRYGDSLLVISDDELVKVHIHAEDLSKVMELAQYFGGLTNIKIENMREQFLAIKEGQVVSEQDQPMKDFGIITVSMGDGIAEIFKSLGADVVIAGGQTMNPSTEDFVKAIKQVQAEKIIILPNNSNIILAAEQSAELVDQEVAVVPTKNVPQGMSALLSYNPAASLEENKDSMTRAKDQVKSGQVTFAVRDTQIDEVSINKGDFMGIFDGKIVYASNEIKATTTSLLDKMIDEDSEIITLIYGEDVKEEQAKEIEDYITAQYPDVDVEVHNGQQPLYSYLIAVE
ncbi:DAK2 domain-containing protein [Caldalkalibacillus mannanilyticus]|uniref:DAK2 domain-containing protein n=1 Tax=Caldalkalibacillus mannanilyticus TaxID=1418 RepID=UPI00054F5B6F|nr:DAK2 domain-containing protein [Caldalkalibacillus mannanilyticus]